MEFSDSDRGESEYESEGEEDERSPPRRRVEEPEQEYEEEEEEEEDVGDAERNGMSEEEAEVCSLVPQMNLCEVHTLFYLYLSCFGGSIGQKYITCILYIVFIFPLLVYRAHI